MTFKELMVQDASLVMFDAEEFAETVTYNGASIKAIVELGPEHADGNIISAEGESDRATIYVMSRDIPKPNRGDVIETDAGSWSVIRPIGSDVAVHTLSCIANESPWRR